MLGDCIHVGHGLVDLTHAELLFARGPADGVEHIADLLHGLNGFAHAGAGLVGAFAPLLHAVGRLLNELLDLAGGVAGAVGQ